MGASGLKSVSKYNCHVCMAHGGLVLLKLCSQGCDVQDPNESLLSSDRQEKSHPLRRRTHLIELYAEMHVLEGSLPGFIHQAVLRPLPDLQNGKTARSVFVYSQAASHSVSDPSNLLLASSMLKSMLTRFSISCGADALLRSARVRQEIGKSGQHASGKIHTSSLAVIRGLSRQDCFTSSRIFSTTSLGNVGSLPEQSAKARHQHIGITTFMKGKEKP